MKKLSYLVLIFGGLFLTQCKKENPHVWNNPQPPGNGGVIYSINKGVAISIDVFGVIQDEQGSPLSGVNVSLGTKVYTSDIYGQVKISQGSAYKEIAYLKAEKAGYFPGSRSFIPQSGVNHFVISMMAKGNPQVFSASSGAILNQGNAEIVMGDAYEDASGNAYTGQVNAYIRHLDPEDPNILKIMPGDLRGADASGEKVLETYGMVVVELEGSAGQKLQLAKDHPASIKTTVPASLLANAPATMPLWHFDEVNGIWSHEGEAKLENGAYVGNVTHFSFWNYDLPNSVARLIGKVTADDGLPIAGIYINYTVAGGSHSGGYPDDHGNFIAQLPLNQDLELEISYQNQIIYTESFNTGNNKEFSKEYKIPSLTFTTISGTVLGCNGSLVPSGSVIVDWFASAPIVDGKYSFKTLMKAGKTIKLTAIYLYGGNSQTRTVVLDQKNITVPAFGLCPANASIDDYEFSFTTNGINYSIEGVKTVVDDDSAIVFLGGNSALDFSTDQSFDFNIWKFGDWATKNQFQYGNNSPSWNGGASVDLGDGIRRNAKLVDITVLSKSPYSIQFSGIFEHYDQTTQSYVQITVSDGKIIEK